MQYFIQCIPFEYGQKWQPQAGRPECGYFTKMMMPEVRGQKGKEGDRKQHTGKRDTTPDGQTFPQVGMSMTVRVGTMRGRVIGILGVRVGM